VPKCAEENFLGDVVELMMIPRKARGGGEDAAAVTPDEFRERIMVSGESLCDEGFISDGSRRRLAQCGRFRRRVRERQLGPESGHR
jgi:hypothetical protein